MEEIKMLENLEALKENEIQEINGGAYEGTCFVYIIKKGDCLSVIAQRYGTTVKLLCEINGIDNPNLIYEGHRLLIPYNS